VFGTSATPARRSSSDELTDHRSVAPHAAQIQHGITLEEPTPYGADYQHIDPRTAGTING
jgi:hypothetical protein